MTGARRVGAGGGAAGFLVVATIRKPHGVRGELVLALETDRPRAVFRNGRALQLGDPAGRPLGAQLTVERTRPFKDGLLLKATEFDSLTPQVEALRGKSLLIPVAEAAPSAADEIHYRDLVGMAVVAGGAPVGVIRGVLETVGGELLAVDRPGARELLLPFVKEWVRGIDRERGVLEIDPPEGLLEL